MSDIADQVVMFIVTWSVFSIYPSPYDTPIRGSAVLPPTVAIGYHKVYRSSHSGRYRLSLLLRTEPRYLLRKNHIQNCIQIVDSHTLAGFSQWQ